MGFSLQKYVSCVCVYVLTNDEGGNEEEEKEEI